MFHTMEKLGICLSSSMNLIDLDCTHIFSCQDTSKTNNTVELRTLSSDAVNSVESRLGSYYATKWFE